MAAQEKSPGTDDDCQPVHEEFPIETISGPFILERKQDNELTQAQRKKEDKNAEELQAKESARKSHLTATQKRAKSIRNYYNILSQNMPSKNKEEYKQSNSKELSIEKGQTLRGDNSCSLVQNGEMNSPNLQNLQSLTINYNSNQNYQSVNFYDEINKDFSGTGPTKKGLGSNTNTRKDSAIKPAGDYANQFSTIKRCQ